MEVSESSEIIDEENAIIVPFDDGNAGSFKLTIHPDETDKGDCIVLQLDRAASRSFAKIFIQLANGEYSDFHFHMGTDETPGSQRGLRIELIDK